MFLNLLFVVLVQCQEILIWFRVSLITERIVEQYIIEDFLILDKIRLSIELSDVPNILMFDTNQQQYSIQIQDKIGQWVKIIANQESIHIDGNIFKIDKQEVDEFQFIQIMRNYDNYFLEILKDEKYNNFVLQNYQQQYLKTIKFNTFISDHDAVITLWIKLMTNYNTINFLYFLSSKNQKGNNYFKLLQIDNNSIIVSNKQDKKIQINGRIWNQIRILIQENYINVEIRSKQGLINKIAINQNIKKIVNKELIIQQQGLYIGHYSIQYESKITYCSPGCISCVDNKCIECQYDQYLADNQCTCLKFYQNQNFNGSCAMFPDLYQKNLTPVLQDLFRSSICQFGYIHVFNQQLQITDCIRCPIFQEQLCEYCLDYINANHSEITCDFYSKPKKYSFEFEIQTQNYSSLDVYKFDSDQFIVAAKHNSFIQKKKNKPKRYILLSDYRQQLQDYRTHKYVSPLLSCPYNCECQISNENVYCMNLLEKRNYIQSNYKGIPLFKNSMMNMFNVEIIVVDQKYAPLYIYKKQNFQQIEDIIKLIDIDSIILNGLHIIQFIIDLQTQYWFSQVTSDLNREILKIREYTLVARGQKFSYNYLHFQKQLQNSDYIPFINLIIRSQEQYQISQHLKININAVDKLTLIDIYILSNLFEMELFVPVVILKNICFNQSFISISIKCKKLTIQDFIFYNISGEEDSQMFNIYTEEIIMKNNLITNCTSNNQIMFLIRQSNYIISSLLFIDKFIIQYSWFVEFILFSVEIQAQKRDIIISKVFIQYFLINQTKIFDSQIFYLGQGHILESIEHFTIANSFISGSFTSSLKANKIDTIFITNCTFNNIYQVFQIEQDQFKEDFVIFTNLILDSVNLENVENLFIFKSKVSISFVSIQHTKMRSGAIFNISTSLNYNSIFSFVSLRNSIIYQMAIIKCIKAQFHHLNIQQSSIIRYLQIESQIIQIQIVSIQNLYDFQLIFDLSSIITLIKQLYITSCQISNFPGDMVIIKLKFDFYGTIIIDHIKLCNNIFSQNLIQFIKVNCFQSRTNLTNIFVSNNTLYHHRSNQIGQEDQHRVSFILIQSYSLLMAKIFIYQLVGEFEDIFISTFQLNADTVIIKQIRFREIRLIRCDLFYLIASEILLQDSYFQQIELILSNAIRISVRMECVIIVNLTCFQMKTDSPIIIILSKDQRNRIYLKYISIVEAYIYRDIIHIESTALSLKITNLKLSQISSQTPLYLLNQFCQIENFSSIQQLGFENIVIYDSEVGLCKLAHCSQIVIKSSKFIKINFNQSFITFQSMNVIFISQTVFSQISLINSSLLDRAQSQKHNLDLVVFENSIIKNVEYQIDENQCLVQLPNLQLFYIFNTNFINNTCILNQYTNICSLICIQKYDHYLGIYFSNTLFSQNDCQFLLQVNQTQNETTPNYLAGIDIVKKKEFVESNQFQTHNTYFHMLTLIRMSKNQQPAAESDKVIKFNINGYHLLEQLISIKKITKNRVINMTNNLKDEIVYLPSGQVLGQYEILQLDILKVKKYISKCLFEMVDYDYINCTLNLIKLNYTTNMYEKLQSYKIQLNQELSNFLQFSMDPYIQEYSYLMELICSNKEQTQVIQYRIKPFPCQMGEYYHNQQCKQCKIEYWYNTIQKNQNKCDQYDQQIVVEMKQGLLKLKTGYWRPNYHNKYFTQCELQQNCQGGWQVEDQSCSEGYLGAQCSECDIYNQRGSGSYSKLNGQCIKCSVENNSLIIYVTIIFIYQLISTYLACNKSLKHIQEQNLIFQQSKYYNILNNLQVDQISILIKFIQDVYIKIILINQLNLNLPDIINIPLNLIPTQLINKGLYCNIFNFGSNILLLELICIFLFTLILIQFCYVLYIILIYKNIIKQSITYLATICQYGYKQSYVYISQLLITQLIYVVVSNEHYLIGNQQYQYKQYKYITLKIVLPIYLVYSILAPILIIIIMNMRNNQKSIQLWAYFVSNYYSKGHFWEVYQLLQYSTLQVIFFYFYQQKQNQLILFTLAIFVDLAMQYKFKIYKLNKLNLIQFQTQLKVISLQTLLCYYYQVSNQNISIIIYGMIMILNFYIVKPILLNIISRLIVQYAHYTTRYQNLIIAKIPSLIRFQRRYALCHNPKRAKENFQKIIKSLKTYKSDETKSNQPIYKNSGPNNSLFTELETSKEMELINFQNLDQN